MDRLLCRGLGQVLCKAFLCIISTLWMLTAPTAPSHKVSTTLPTFSLPSPFPCQAMLGPDKLQGLFPVLWKALGAGRPLCGPVLGPHGEP